MQWYTHRTLLSRRTQSLVPSRMAYSSCSQIPLTSTSFPKVHSLPQSRLSPISHFPTPKLWFLSIRIRIPRYQAQPKFPQKGFTHIGFWSIRLRIPELPKHPLPPQCKKTRAWLWKPRMVNLSWESHMFWALLGLIPEPGPEFKPISRRAPPAGCTVPQWSLPSPRRTPLEFRSNGFELRVGKL